MHRKKSLAHKKEMEARALRREERSERTRKAAAACPPVERIKLGKMKKVGG